jgi:hypothetical protein
MIVETAFDCADPVIYLVLSYVWGGDQPQMTTDEKYCQSKTVNYDMMPKTIQDAIKVTQKLGYAHLWVDSMCIIQDNDEDKALEIMRMTQVYSNAAFTIAAACADSVFDGFLKPREARYLHFFELPCKNRYGKIGKFMFSDKNQKGPMLAGEKLHSRGWVMQERLLSKHTLQYGVKQVKWLCECNGGTHRATDGWRPVTSSDDSTYKLDDPTAFPSNWETIVNEYTRRNLSVPTDRLLAISGIAQRLGDIIKDKYYCGIWNRQFPFGLLWASTEQKIPTPPDVYQGPSWSWAGINGSIRPVWNEKSSTKSTKHLQVLKVSVDLAQEGAKYGAVRKAVLEARAPLLIAWWISDSPLTYEGMRSARQGFSIPGRLREDVNAADVIDKDPSLCGSDGLTIYLALVCSRIENGTREEFWLMLRDLGTEGASISGTDKNLRQFVRLGVFNRKISSYDEIQLIYCKNEAEYWKSAASETFQIL